MAMPIPSNLMRGALFAWAALSLVTALHAESQAGQQPLTSRSVSWKDWAAPFEDPFGAQPDALKEPWNKDLLVPPRLPLSELRSDNGIPPIDAQALSCMRVEVAVSTLSSRAAHRLAGLEVSRLEQEPVALTLSDALRMALCLNPDVRTSWTMILRASADLGLSQSQYWPQATAAVMRQHSRVSGAAPGTTSSSILATSESLGISWRVFDFGARQARVDAARAQVRAALAGQNMAVREVATHVIDTFVQTQAVQAQLARQAEIAALGQSMLASATRRYEQGASGSNAVLQAQATHARNRLETDKIEAELSLLKQRLRNLTGIAPLQEVLLEAIPDELDATPRQQDLLLEEAPLAQAMQEPLSQWLVRAREVSPSVIAAAAKLDAAAAAAEAVKADAWPRIDLAYNHYRNGRPTQTLVNNRTNERTIGVTLTLPLFDGFSDTYRIRSAVASREEARIALEAAQLDAEQELMDAFTQAQSSLLLLESAKRLYHINVRVVQSNEALFAQGVLDSIEVNRGLLDLQSANNELTQAHAQWLRAKLRLWLLAA